MRVRPDVVRIVHVAKPDCFPSILRTFIRHTSWRRAYCARRGTKSLPYDTLCTFIRQYASASCIVSNVVSIVHVAKPNRVHAILNSGVVCIVQVAKRDVVNTTIRHCARSYDIRLLVLLTVHVVKPDDTRLCRETRWRLYDTLCAFV